MALMLFLPRRGQPGRKWKGPGIKQVGSISRIGLRHPCVGERPQTRQEVRYAIQGRTNIMDLSSPEYQPIWYCRGTGLPLVLITQDLKASGFGGMFRREACFA